MYTCKEERIKQGQTNNKAKQHSTPCIACFFLPSFSSLMYMYIRATDRSKKRKVPLSHGEEVDIDVSSLE